MVVSRLGETEFALRGGSRRCRRGWPCVLCAERRAASGVGGARCRQHNDRAVHPHLYLQVSLRAAVVHVGAGIRRFERIGDGATVRGFPRQQTWSSGECAGTGSVGIQRRRAHLKVREQDRGAAGGLGQAVGEGHRYELSLTDDEGRSGDLHRVASRAGNRRRNEVGRRAGRATVAPRIHGRAIRLTDVRGLRNEVEHRGCRAAGGAGHSRCRSVCSGCKEGCSNAHRERNHSIHRCRLSGIHRTHGRSP